MISMRVVLTIAIPQIQNRMRTLQRTTGIMGCLAVMLLTAASFSWGQVRDYSARLETKRGVEVTKIAVDDFTPAAGKLLFPSDSVTLTRVAEIIRADLDFSPFYDIVVIDSFYLKHMEMTAMTLLGWSQLGAEYVVRGEAEFSGSEITVKYKLFYAKSGIEFARGSFKSPSSNFRRLAHKVANEIIYYLTGEQGIFDTRICFVSDRTGNKELYLCDYDGANIYQLTGNKSINISPSFSPDDRKILFTSYMRGDPQIYQYDVVSGAVDLLAAYPGVNSTGQVSPDNKTIVCSLTRDGDSELYLLERSGKIKNRLTYSSAIESSPCWSPTGSEICFTSDRTGNPQLYIMDKDGINVRRITFLGNYNDSPDWSPKGDKIVFVSRVEGKFNICTVDVTGENFRVLTELGNNENPHWSPDGNHIVFSSNRSGAKEIYIMDRFGNEERRLTTGGGNTNPAWSGHSQ